MSIEPYALETDARAAVLDVVSRPLAAAFDHAPVLLPVVPFSARAQEVADALGAAIVSIGLTDSQSAPHATDESISEDLFLRTIDFVQQLVGPVDPAASEQSDGPTDA